MALSDDHKPNRPDERERVLAAGGRVIFAGCWRVQVMVRLTRLPAHMPTHVAAHLRTYPTHTAGRLPAVPRPLYSYPCPCPYPYPYPCPCPYP